ncbi:MAG: nitrilase-related carbon-nitrogen hydrolase [Nitrososphaeria archaeon]
MHQYSAHPNKLENLNKIVSLIEDSDSYVNIFPEYCMGVPEDGLTRSYIIKNAESVKGNFVNKILECTERRSSIAIFTMYLRERGRVYNAAILADKGRVKSIYKKIHLFDAYGYRESSIFSEGNQVNVISLDGIKLGLAICFDLRFPELFRYMAYKGVDVFIVPSGWYKGKFKLKQWKTLTICRAHENVSFLIAVNQSNPLFIGHSLAASPFGTVLGECGSDEQSLTIKLDFSLVKSAREIIPIIKLSKPFLYNKMYSEIISF